MARKSRKRRTPEAAPAPGMRMWRAALYIRLSVEFNGNHGDSLETQKGIMEAYLAGYRGRAGLHRQRRVRPHL